MSSRVVALVVLFIWLQAPAQPQKPAVFRAGIDLMQLDVTVLDKDGRPVRGLTKEDFTLLEDGKPQTIEGFTAIDLPDAVHDGPVWSRDVPPDVTTNEIDNHRIFVMVIDDGRGIGTPGFGRHETIRTAEAFVDLLGPRDLAAVVFTEHVKLSQNLTSDRARLLKAIRSLPTLNVNQGRVWVAPIPSIRSRGEAEPCYSVRETLRLFEAIVRHLSTLPDRRKAIIYYGVLPWAELPTDDDCGTYWGWRDVFTAAQLGHVTINPVQPGLTGDIPEHYLAVAENTGGHAVIQSNDAMPGLRQILVENSSYYLLAYQPRMEHDGRFRRFTVTVNRPGVEVVTRRGFWAPGPLSETTRPEEPPSPQIEALAGVLPSSALNLRVNAAPFAIAGTDRAVVAVSLGVRQPAFASRTREHMELLVKAFTPDGEERATDALVVPIAVPAARAGVETTRYDVLARLEVPSSGRYELRISAMSSATNERGSVYADIEVPDFRRAKVSLSGVVLNSALGAAPAAPAGSFVDLTPLVPTTERSFAASDIVTTCLRVYQGGNDRLDPVLVKVTIRDAGGATVFEQRDTIAVDRFGKARAADYQLRLPLTTLSAGEHVLTFDASAGKVAARRDLRFSRR
jgi:VWFA-related protein